MKYSNEHDNTERVTFRVNIDTMKMLRKLSYLTEKPIAVLLREATKKVINDNKKVLTNTKNVV